jgi:hypothetical protein
MLSTVLVIQTTILLVGTFSSIRAGFLVLIAGALHIGHGFLCRFL